MRYARCEHFVTLVHEFSERREDGRLVVDTRALNEHLHNIGPKWDLLTFMGLREERGDD